MATKLYSEGDIVKIGKDEFEVILVQSREVDGVLDNVTYGIRMKTELEEERTRLKATNAKEKK